MCDTIPIVRGGSAEEMGETLNVNGVSLVPPAGTAGKTQIRGTICPHMNELIDCKECDSNFKIIALSEALINERKIVIHTHGQIVSLTSALAFERERVKGYETALAAAHAQADAVERELRRRIELTLNVINDEEEYHEVPSLVRVRMVLKGDSDW